MMMTDRRHARYVRFIAVLLMVLLMTCSGFTSSYALEGADEEGQAAGAGVLELEQEEELEEDEEGSLVEAVADAEEDADADENKDAEAAEDSDADAADTEEKSEDAGAGKTEEAEPVKEEPKEEKQEEEETVVDGDNKSDYSDYTSTGTELYVRSVSYDPDEKEVEFSFNTKVQYRTGSNGRNVTVKIYAEDGKKNLVSSNKKYGTKKLTVSCKKLKYGYKYKYVISGVKKKGSTKYFTLTGTFRAIK